VIDLTSALLESNSGLFAHGRDDGDDDFLVIIESLLDALSYFALRNLDVVLLATISGHEVKEAFVDVNEGIFVTLDVGDVHVVRGGTDIFQFLSGEDVSSDQVDLGMSVLASLGSRHINDFARASLDYNVSAFAEGAALHGEGEGSPGGGTLELLLLMLLVVAHGRYKEVKRGLDGVWDGVETAGRTRFRGTRIFQGAAAF